MPLVLRNPNFGLVWLGQLFSQSGVRMYQIAIVWWILGKATERSGMALGIFLLLGALPSILFVKLIGSFVERHSSKPILVICDLINFCLIAGVALALHFDVLPIWGASLGGFFIGTVQALFDPTLNKALPTLVDEKELEGAVAFQSSTQSIAYFAGAVIGAILIDQVGIATVAAINAGSYFLSAILNSVVRYRSSAVSSSEEFTAGWAALAPYPLVKKILVTFGCINFFATPTLIILPLYTSQTLHGSASLLGALEASIWLGLMAGSFLGPMIRIERGIARFGGTCLALFGIGLFLPGVIVSYRLYLILLFLGGIALGLNNVKFISYFQRTIAPELKGRFFALMQALISFTFPIAYFAFGVLGDHVKPPTICLIQGMGVMLLSFYLFFLGEEKVEVPSLEGGIGHE